MADTEKSSPAAETVRKLAAEGRLKDYFRAASTGERRWLRTGATEIIWPLVFTRVTRPVEYRRGHHACAAGVHRLAPDCLDRFHDDVAAVVDDLFANANLRIANLEGWITVRLGRATVDGYRRRRGERGAPQRPRVPVWLADALNRDPWLIELAKAVLDWAGTDATAGTALWPLTAWVNRRAAVTGEHTAGEVRVAAEVEVVLAAMRRRATWYEKNVERPLGRKQAPVWSPGRDAAEPEPLALIEPYERDEALLQELAARALDVMTRRIDAGENPEVVVAEVLEVVFGASDEAAPLITDPDRRRRVTATVTELLRRR